MGFLQLIDAATFFRLVLAEQKARGGTLCVPPGDADRNSPTMPLQFVYRDRVPPATITFRYILENSIDTCMKLRESFTADEDPPSS